MHKLKTKMANASVLDDNLEVIAAFLEDSDDLIEEDLLNLSEKVRSLFLFSFYVFAKAFFSLRKRVMTEDKLAS